jgi:hypothetical protein
MYGIPGIIKVNGIFQQLPDSGCCITPEFVREDCISDFNVECITAGT